MSRPRKVDKEWVYRRAKHFGLFHVHRYRASTDVRRAVRELVEEGRLRRVGYWLSCDHYEPVETPVMETVYLYHPESESAFPCDNEKELEVCLLQGCEYVSEYYCLMVEIGLHEYIDHEWDRRHMLYSGV